ncbi:MAG: hypothetical protein HC841_00290 [Verrucomicrobiae bacterium]|nr:hypothetical protein [Verrucomicrobiae bacterium]
MITVSITGRERLVRSLMHLRKSQTNSIVRQGLKSLARVAVRYIKAAVPHEYKQAKKCIAFKVKTSKKTGIQMTRVGAVGKQPDIVPRDDRPGVGLVKKTFHWFAIGTKDRKTKNGMTRGRMPAVLSGLVSSGSMAAEGEGREAMRATVKRGVDRAVHKAKRKR